MSAGVQHTADPADETAETLRDLMLPLDVFAGAAAEEGVLENETPEIVQARYLEDLRTIMRMPGGAGLRVLRRWLDEAQAYSPLSLPAPQIYAATALFDYARERMAEAVVADPVGFLRIHLAGVRRSAGHITPNP